MANITRRPQSDAPISSLRREIDQLFEDFFTNPFGGMSQLAQVAFSPSLELSETDDGYLLAAELPGIDENDVEVQIDDNVLSIRGEKKREEKKTGKGYEYSERSYGSFSRAVRLPPGTDPDKVVASFHNGVLEVRIPKGEGQHPRAVKIQKEEEKSEAKAESTPETKSK